MSLKRVEGGPAEAKRRRVNIGTMAVKPWGSMAYPFKISPPLKSAARVVLLIFLFISPLFLLSWAKQGHSFKLLFFFYLLNFALFIYLVRKYFNEKSRIEYAAQQMQEKLNIINDENEKEIRNYASLQAKILRYNSLKRIVEEINKSLILDSIAEQLSAAAFSLISNNKGACLMYLVDNQTQNLSLLKAKKEGKKIIIKAKEGDIFDHWVLRHCSALIIEDIKKDFRFDLEKLKHRDLRPISSLISSPFISESRLLGVLRLDNNETNFYSQDDLRFLCRICDLGAVALENSELFEKTQELAIHDELTSLFTKGYFLQHLKEECESASRRNREFSLLMLDIDLFKNYNDKFGHTAGDIVLRRTSQVITNTLKGLEPFVSRFGGEEFCVILPGLDKKKSYAIAESLRERIEEEKIILRRQETFVTVSIGVSGFPSDADRPDGLIEQADKAMYEAKQKGRNRVCCI
mgnify:CR=1 FL=1